MYWLGTPKENAFSLADNRMPPGCRARAMGWGWRTDNPVKGLKRYEEEKRHRWQSGR